MAYMKSKAGGHFCKNPAGKIHHLQLLQGYATQGTGKIHHRQLLRFCDTKPVMESILGFFGQSVTGGGGGGGLLGPPLCISGTNNARVMKFTHNDHLHTKKAPHPVLTCHAQ